MLRVRSAAIGCPRLPHAPRAGATQEEGFLVLRGLFSPEEAQVLKGVANRDELSLATNEETGKRSKIFFPDSQYEGLRGNDVYNAVSRCSRMVDAMEVRARASPGYPGGFGPYRWSS